jgi:hypothetical protein
MDDMKKESEEMKEEKPKKAKASKDAKAKKKVTYVINQNRALNSEMGMLHEGTEVNSAMFGHNQELFDKLISIEAIVERN